MLNYLLQPNFQFVDINGKPLVGGWIEVYLHNTTTQYITKADFDGTDNPFKVVLDSKGMAVVIADDANAYDVLVYGKDGGLFWSASNVTISTYANVRGEGAIDVTDVGDIPNREIVITIKPNSIGRDLLKNHHNLVPDSNYLQFKDFGGNVVVTLCDDLKQWLEDEGY
ncbi:MAG: hypothetical protein IIZ94_06475 [Prevotella sp.]|nr:hypothetical protein [Prevotella sp.]